MTLTGRGHHGLMKATSWKNHSLLGHHERLHPSILPQHYLKKKSEPACFLFFVASFVPILPQIWQFADLKEMRQPLKPQWLFYFFIFWIEAMCCNLSQEITVALCYSKSCCSSLSHNIEVTRTGMDCWKRLCVEAITNSMERVKECFALFLRHWSTLTKSFQVSFTWLWKAGKFMRVQSVRRKAQMTTGQQKQQLFKTFMPHFYALKLMHFCACYWEIEICNNLKVKGFENPVLLMAEKLHSETCHLFGDRDRSYRKQSWALNQCDLGFSWG